MEIATFLKNCLMESRYAKASFFTAVRSKGIDEHVEDLLGQGIVIENQSVWSKHSRGDVMDFVDAMNRHKVSDFLSTNQQKLFITKDKDVPPSAVKFAVLKTMGIIKECGYKAMGLLFSPEINLVVTSGQEFTARVPRKGTIIFDKRDLGEETLKGHRHLYFGEHRTQLEALKEIDQFSHQMGLPIGLDESFVRDMKHIRDVIMAYYQIPFLCYNPGTFVQITKHSRMWYVDRFLVGRGKYDDTQSEKSFVRLVWPAVSERRIRGNFRYLQDLASRVPYQLMLQSIVCHDIGKINPSGSHPEVGAEYFDKKGFLRGWKLDGSKEEVQVYRLIIKNIIRHHLVPGGISMGEYSLMCLYDMFTEDEMVKILAAGNIDLFIDALTLLTACDMAGQKKAMMPLNKRIEDAAELNAVLKGILHGLLDMTEENKEYLFKMLLQYSVRRSMFRLYGYLGADDQMLDVNTEGGYESFYGKKLQEAFARLKMSREEKHRLDKFLALASSFPYSAKPISFILWKGNENDLDNPGQLTGERSEVNENALRFLSFLAGQVGNEVLQSNTLITVCFADENGKILKGEKDNIIKHPELIKALKRAIEAGERYYPGIIVERKVDMVLVKICIRLQIETDGKRTS